MKRRNNSRQIKIGILISYFSIGVNVLLTLLYTPWMIEKLGQEQYGLYTLATSLVSLIAFDFGMSAAVSRYLAKYRAEDMEDEANNFASAVFQIYFLIDVILLLVFIILFFCIEILYKGLTFAEIAIFKKVYLIVAFYTLLSFPGVPLNGILTAYERFIELKVTELIQRTLSVVLVVFFLLRGADVAAIVFANAIVGIPVMLVRFLIVKKDIGLKIKLNKRFRDIYRNILSFSIWSSIGSMSVNLTYSLVPSIFAITLNSTAIALYSPASVLGSYFYSVASAVNGMFLPTVSRYVADGSDEKITDLMIRVGRYQTFVMGLIYMGYVCVGDQFIYLWLGEDFSASYICAIFTMFPLIFRYSQQIGNTTIVAKNYVKLQGIIFIVITIAGNLLVLALSKCGGVVGGCVAVSFTTMAYVFGLNYIHQRKVGINVRSFYKNCYSSMIIPMVAVSVAGRLVLPLVGSDNLMWFVVKTAIVVVVYISSMWKIGLRESEKKYIIGQLDRMMGR